VRLETTLGEREWAGGALPDSSTSDIMALREVPGRYVANLPRLGARYNVPRDTSERRSPVCATWHVRGLETTRQMVSLGRFAVAG